MGALCLGWGWSAPADDLGGKPIDGPASPQLPAVVSRDALGRVTVRAIHLGEALQIDGRLEEDIYRISPSINGFIQQDPQEGAPATEDTKVWVFFDDEQVYISARCRDSQPGRIVANEMRRDNPNISRNDHFTIMLDTFYDRRSGFLFQTNPVGGLYDAQFSDEANVNSDWNTVWEVRTARAEQGWTLEVAIPFKSLRYSEEDTQVWGINFRRVVRWKNEHSTLTPMLVEHPITRASSAATLVGLETPRRSRNLEIKPYVASALATDYRASPPRMNDAAADAGLDVKFGITRGLTWDTTVNTDFAQVEADDEQVNLTRFSLFFPEKREFFLEGQGIFDFGGASQGGPLFHASNTPIIFFSRRIGLSEGRNVPIVAGTRLTGKTGKFALGGLLIRTGEEPAAGAVTTDFSVIRVKRDILGRSFIGGIATRRAPSVTADASNKVYGIDTELAFFQNLRLVGYYARSVHPAWSGNDASYRALFDYNSDFFELKLERLVAQENFRPEIGFLRRQNFRQSFGYLRLSPRPGSIGAIRKWGGVVSFDYITDGSDRLESRTGFLEFFVDLENGDTWDAHLSRYFEWVKEAFPIAEAVFVPAGTYRFQELVTNYRFGPQRRIPSSFGFTQGSFYGGHRTEVSFQARVEVTPMFSLEPRILVDWIKLAESRVTTKLVSTRVTYTFSPRVFVGALIQFNSSTQSFSTNLRFRWEYRPGSEVFVVLGDNRDILHGVMGLRDRSLVIKVTRLFRF